LKLSICIPTYNRAQVLKQCLDSILVSLRGHEWIEICVSDNASLDDTVEVIESYQAKLPITFSSNNENIGLARNVLEVTKLAKGDFIWLVGDDDYLMPDALDRLYEIMHDRSHKDIKFFYNNAFTVGSMDEILAKGGDFNSFNLTEVLCRSENKKIEFLELIDHKISWDFLGGMFMSIFHADSWRSGLVNIDQEQLFKPGTFSSLENTFIHLKIFPYAFRDSKAFINYNPIIIATSDSREWSSYWYLVYSRWLIAALEEYRKNGLGFWQYIRNKNKISEKFFPYFVMMLWHKKKYSLSWKDLINILAKNCLYPNAYLSIFYSIYYSIRKLKT
tara:strand:- start:227 stop:1222 length:996 start_codon:yes stop_codon:yes gene_type:complete